MSRNVTSCHLIPTLSIGSGAVYFTINMFQTEQGPDKIRNIGGPHNLGDPDDRTLRKVEKEVLIPKIMRDRAKVEKCVEVVKAFEDCCKASSMLMVVKCRKENDDLKSCLEHWYKDEQFQNECKEIYLKDRSEYRRTGLTKKKRQALAAELGTNSSRL